MLFQSRTATWTATEKLIERLEDLHSKDFLSFDWRMWAHYIQGFDSSEHDTLTNQDPPSKLSHLFVNVSDQNLYQKLLEDKKIQDESSEKEEDSDKPQSIYNLLQLTKEDAADKTQLKQCPFTGCSSVIKISSFPYHFKHCRYNPHKKLIHHCRYEGCSRSYATTWDFKKHLLSCRFNPNREARPTRQCPYCSSTPVNLVAHIHSRHSTTKYICDTCGVEKSSKGSLKSHIMMSELFCIYCQ